MHVYTPPGYESGKEKYPVFYLLHGSGDNDDCWTSVGRANYVFDNLIAEKKAKPMVVIMPASHTQNTTGGGRAAGPASTDPNVPSPPDEFTQDFLTDLMPYAESHYRIITDRAHRAIAGLSLGGSQTLNIAIPHLNEFAYVGVFSSGLLGALRAAPGADGTTGASLWESQHKGELDNAAWKKGLKMVWFSTGKEDSLLPTSKGTVDLLNKHGYNATFRDSPGGHTWSSRPSFSSNHGRSAPCRRNITRSSVRQLAPRPTRVNSICGTIALRIVSVVEWNSRDGPTSRMWGASRRIVTPGK
jgi:enterochelin esterase family protein